MLFLALFNYAIHLLFLNILLLFLVETENVFSFNLTNYFQTFLLLASLNATICHFDIHLFLFVFQKETELK